MIFKKWKLFQCDFTGCIWNLVIRHHSICPQQFYDVLLHCPHQPERGWGERKRCTKQQKYKPGYQDVTAGACLLTSPLHGAQDASECLHSRNCYFRPQFSWVAMSSLLPLHQLATRPWGQRGQKWQARLHTACEYGRNNFPGDCFSITAQLYSIAREIHNMGSAVGASSNLCLVAWSYHTAGAQSLITIGQQGESICRVKGHTWDRSGIQA